MIWIPPDARAIESPSSAPWNDREPSSRLPARHTENRIGASIPSPLAGEGMLASADFYFCVKIQLKAALMSGRGIDDGAGPLDLPAVCAGESPTSFLKSTHMCS